MAFRLFLRTIAALSLIGIFSHQYCAIDGVYGWNIISVSILAILLCFYAFTYFYQFHQQALLALAKGKLCKDKCHNMQWLLLGLNIALNIFDCCLHTSHLSWVESGKVGFESIFMIFTEYFLFLLATFFDGEE